MNSRRLILGLFLAGGLSLALASDAAAQRMGNPAAGRMPNPMLGGSIRTAGMGVNPGFNPGFNPGMGGIGNVNRAGFGGQYWGNNQGIQPANFRVPFTYTPGYNWYNQMPYGYWGGNWGGVPYFWYNNFWYRSMWFRGMPYFIPVPVETVPQQMQDQYNRFYQMQQKQQNQNNNNQNNNQLKKAGAANEKNNNN